MTEKAKQMFPVNRVGGLFRGRSDIRLLEQYEWLDDYFRLQSIQAELKDLGRQRAKTAELPVTNAEMLKICKDHHENYKLGRRQLIQKALQDIRDDRDPIKGLTFSGNLVGHSVGSIKFFGFIDWPEIEAAIKALPKNPAALSTSDRIKTLKYIDERIAKLRSEVEKIFPKGTSRFRVSGFGGDIRDTFVEHWIQIQKKCDGPVGPFGTALKYSSDAEKAAFTRLGIGNFVKKDAPYQPNDPYSPQNPTEKKRPKKGLWK